MKERLIGEVEVLYIIYNLILIIIFLLYIPFLIYNFFRGKYKKGFWERLGILPQVINTKFRSEPTIWIHAASVGETIAATPLVKEIKKEFPEYKILFSTMTDTGREMAASIDVIDGLIYFPLDLSWIVRRVLLQINPELVILVETELWPNFIREIKKCDSRIMIASGRISDSSIDKYKYLGPLLKKTLDKVDAFSMQTKKDRRRIISLGADRNRVYKNGNIKYDREFVNESIDENDIYSEFKLSRQQPILVAGSTHEKEEEQLISVYQGLKQNFSDLVMFLAPRYIERADEIEEICQQAGIRTRLRTKVEERKPEKEQVIIVNTLGELTQLYSIADLVFVGGSLIPRGGHNILEPAAHGKLVFFGPHMFNFKEETGFILRQGAGVQIDDVTEMQEKMLYYLNHPSELIKKGRKARQVIDVNKGATTRNIKIIDDLLNN